MTRSATSYDGIPYGLMPQPPYSERVLTEQPDGSWGWETEQDRINEELGRVIASKMHGRLYTKMYGPFRKIDNSIYDLDSFKLIGKQETKASYCLSSDHKTVRLNCRKKRALYKYGLDSDLLLIFIVMFKDKMLWIDLREIMHIKAIRGGCHTEYKSKNDKDEWLIPIPISMMHEMHEIPQLRGN